MKQGLLVIFLALFAGCGLNATLSLNETVPSGTVIFQGQFLTPATVSGTAQLYNSGGQIVIRFQGLTTPTDTRYTLFLEQNGTATAVYVAQLKAPLGNQNYATGLAVGPTFTRVVFRGNSNASNPEISSASLVVVP